MAVIRGTSGNDTLRGVSGTETLEGGDGDDLLIAGNGTGASRYELIKENLTWNQAKAAAEARGGHLGVITSESEWQTVRSLLEDDFRSLIRVWLGASDVDEEGVWKWVTGEEFSYNRFPTGFDGWIREPNDGRGANYLDWMESWKRYEWNDEGDSVQPAYLLETPLPTSSNAFLSGGAGNDTLRGGGGNDTLEGGDGNDLLDASFSSLPQIKLSGWATGDNNFALYKGNADGTNLTLIAQDSDASWGSKQQVGEFTLNSGDYLYAVVVEASVPSPTGFIADLGLVKTSDLTGWKAGQGVFSYVRANWFELPTVEEIEAAISTTSWSDPGVWNFQPIAPGITGIATAASPRASFGIARYAPDFSKVSPAQLFAGGNNSLSGGAGNDTLRGGGGNDTLNGGDGNDLLDASSVSLPMDAVRRGDSAYFVVEGPSWEEAEANAAKLGGHLVTINNADENRWLFETFKIDGGPGNTANTYWAGFNDLKQEGSWEWVNGEQSDYTNWAPSEPAGPHDYLVLGRYGSSGLWNDADSEASKGIAEIKLPSALATGGKSLLIGGAGNDTLIGGAGNDTLDGGSGSDSVSGGKGNDTYRVDNAADVVTEHSLGGTDGVFASVSHTLGAHFENLAASSAAGLNLRGNGLQNFITGGAGADTLDGGGTSDVIRIAIAPAPIIPDTLSGGLGNDLYIRSNAFDPEVIIEAPGGGTDTVRSSVTHSLAANVENLILTGSAAINGTGNALANRITGNAAANRLLAGAGNDSVFGGAGNDTLNAGVGNDMVKGEAGNDLLQIDWTSLAGAAITRNVRRDGTGTTASFSGSYTAKNASGAVLSQVSFDTIERLTLNGQAVDLEKAVAVPGVTIRPISAAAATTEQGGTVEYNVVLDKAPFEDVTLKFASSDATEGKVNTPSLTFTAQNWDKPQKLVVQGVDDYLDDGNVAYTINGQVVTADLTYNRVKVPVLNLLNNDDGQDNDRIIYGSDDTDYLTGANGHDRIYGKGGQDQLSGGIGNDRVYGENDNDRLFGQLGNDELYGGYDDDTLDGGAGADSLFGEQGRDTLIGGAGNDYLDGGLLNDSMSGGAGNDTYLVDSTGDVINDLGAATDVDTVQIIQTINYTLAANIENAAITAGGNSNLTGNSLNNGLTGNDGRNVIDGGVGNDRLDGAGGADSLLGGAGNDVFLGGMGNDTMRGGDGVDMANFVEAGVDLRVDLNTGRISGEGTDLIFDIENILAGDGQDTLLGNAAGNDLDGGAGIDSLSGGGGNDTLAGCFFGAAGGRGEIDSLTGGVGLDVFQLGWSSGRFYDDGIAGNAGRNDYVLITDFTVGQDRLQLDGAAGSYFFGASGLNGVSGIGLYAEQGATDELIAIIRSANTTQLTAANTISTAQFV